jgi:hypothetical protein
MMAETTVIIMLPRPAPTDITITLHMGALLTDTMARNGSTTASFLAPVPGTEEAGAGHADGTAEAGVVAVGAAAGTDTGEDTVIAGAADMDVVDTGTAAGMHAADTAAGAVVMQADAAAVVMQADAVDMQADAVAEVVAFTVAAVVVAFTAAVVGTAVGAATVGGIGNLWQ